MKTLRAMVGVIMVALAALGTVQINATDNNDQLRNRFYLSVGGASALGTETKNAEVREQAHYWEADITAGYKWYVHKGLFLSPEVGTFGLFFNDNNNDNIDTNTDRKIDDTFSFYGFNINGLVGYTFTDAVVPVDIFTGVVGEFGFCTKNVTHSNNYDLRKDTIRGASWRFGFGINPGRFSIRLMYDIRLGNNVIRESNQDLFPLGRSIDGYKCLKYNYKMINKLSLSIAYNF
jgi:hypothetical protein